MVAGQHFPGGTDRVQRVRLACPAPGRALGVVDFDDDLAMGVQKPGQSDAVAAGAFHRPHQPWTRGEGEVEQCW
jgi:hypothetical protein